MLKVYVVRLWALPMIGRATRAMDVAMESMAMILNQRYLRI